ncbi:MAG: hypothetical protein PSV24_01610 [Rhodoferax sp.]|nr:hypothetical protein [Rhodoferax sp.]
MPIEAIHRITYWFDHAFRGLSVDVPPAEVRDLARLVCQCLDGNTRTYHTSFHVLSLCDGMQPIQVLAALFHDVVFVQLDGGFPIWVSDLLKGVTRAESESLRLQEVAPDDHDLALCADIFGFRPNDVLAPNAGMNEFLSSVVAVRLLRRHLSSAQLIAVAACIELTIPFRAPDAQGNTPAQALAQRVQARCASLFDAEPQRAAFIKTTLTEAVIFANRDVMGFIDASPEHCLSNSMLLVEESMMPQAASSASSLLSYRRALLGMDTFLSQLKPAYVGQSFAGCPNARTVVQMQTTTQKNITFVRDYLAAVLSSVAIIEALSRITGSDYPRTLLLSDMRCAEADFFPVPKAGLIDSDALLQLLKSGLVPDENPGLNALPLTACVYRFMGPKATRQTYEQAKQLFDGTLSAQAFLQQLNRDMVGAIIRLAAELDAPQKEAILALEHSLYANHHSI